MLFKLQQNEDQQCVSQVSQQDQQCVSQVSQQDQQCVSSVSQQDQQCVSSVSQQETYTLPKVKIYTSDIPSLPQELYGYNQNLNICRNKIDSIDVENWKKVRWYINVYDFQVKDPIINRAFYKYWEIINEFEIFENYTNSDIILHCAEAPGGFIQGTNIYLQVDRIVNKPPTIEKPDDDGFIVVKNKKKNKQNHKIYSISLNKELPQYKNYNLPSYNKNIVNKFLYITYGKDNTGDINNLENINYIHTLAKKHFYLITADGGFDEGTDFNHKEQLHYKLISSEIYSAILLQKENGHFILKVFDILTETSIHLIYLLLMCYREVYIYKPKTSRPTNSEKYIICKHFKLNEEQRKQITDTLKNLSVQLKNQKSKFVSFTLFDHIPDCFIQSIKHVNTELLKTQCDHLEKAIQLCNDTNFLENYEFNLSESLEKRREIFHDWELTYNLNAYV
jgi:23S rRNA U2552 (ribose-2'-O)-methylase RlmE/FtsJ